MVFNKSSLFMSMSILMSILIQILIMILPLPFQHKLHYFLFCRTFEILFIICADTSLKSKLVKTCLNYTTFKGSDFNSR
jgi:hypothetical protein